MEVASNICQADTAIHVISMHLEPSRFSTYTASYDVASNINICQAVADGAALVHRGDGDPEVAGRVRGEGGHQGKAVQVDPIKPTLKAHATKRLKLEYGELLSSSAFNCNLRRYTKKLKTKTKDKVTAKMGKIDIDYQAGAYTRSLLSST
jgi:hypothetical protein